MRENWTRCQDNRIELTSSNKHKWWAVIVKHHGLWTFTIGIGRRRYTWHPFQGFTETKQAKKVALNWINWIAETENRLNSKP